MVIIQLSNKKKSSVEIVFRILSIYIQCTMPKIQIHKDSKFNMVKV